MAEKFRLSRPASIDIDEIWNYTFESSLNLEVADKVVRTIYEAIDFLVENPGAGHAREDLTDKPLKFWGVYRYLVVYRPASTIEIVAVLHTARDATELLEDR